MLLVSTLAATAASEACTLDQSGLQPLDASATVDRPVMPPVDVAADAGCASCAPCQRCGNDGICELDPSSLWQIVCVSASVAASPPGRDFWDTPSEASPTGAPDPFCQFATVATGADANSSGVTTTIMDNFMPSWNQVVTPPGQTVSASDLLDPHASWKLIVGDDDGCTTEGCMAETICSLPPPMNASWLTDGQVTIALPPSCLALSLRLVCQP